MDTMMNILKDNAKNLRKNSTDAENKIWYEIKNRKLKYKFIRQYVFDDKYIVDFICREKKLVIEIDGGQHCDNNKDRERDAYLLSRGYKVLRLWNNDVIKNLDGCLQTIIKELED